MYQLPNYLKCNTTDSNRMSAEVVSISDNRLAAWANSRPNIVDLDPDKMDDVYAADFGISDSCHITLQLRTSVLMREALFSFRGLTPWAQTSRVLPIEKTQVSSEYSGEELELSQALIRDAAKDFENGVPQDLARLKVPVTASTCYFMGANFRTWVIICKTLRKLGTRITNLYADLIWKAIVRGNRMEAGLFLSGGQAELDFYKYDTKGLALSSVSVGSDFKEGSSSSMGMTTTAFQTSLGHAAQFARHQHNLFRSSIWSLFTSMRGSHHQIDLTFPVNIITVMPESSYRTILSHRAEWLADWNLWSGFLKAGTMHMTDQEFFELLDDPMNYLGDNLERIKGTDPNIPDPRILEMPDLILRRAEHEGDNYISSRWMALLNAGYFHDNPNNEYRIQYGELNKDPVLATCDRCKLEFEQDSLIPEGEYGYDHVCEDCNEQLQSEGVDHD